MKNFRLVRKNNKREMKKKFTIRIEEHISQAFEIDAEDIGDEQAVEQAALQQPGQLGPVAQFAVVAGAVAWVGPEAVVDMADALHAEGV